LVSRHDHRLGCGIARLATWTRVAGWLVLNGSCWWILNSTGNSVPETKKKEEKAAYGNYGKSCEDGRKPGAISKFEDCP
jgi:hypothetical protein